MIADLCTTEASVKRETNTVDTGGAPIRHFDTIGAIACRIRQASATARQIHAQGGVAVTHDCWCVPPSEFDINQGDALTINELGELRIFRVKYVNDVHEQGHHLKIALEELVDGADSLNVE